MDQNTNSTPRNKISEVISSSLEKIRTMVDADSVIGTPIETPSGTVIIPVSKVSVGFVGGGNDYAGKNAQASGKNNFGGASGSGLTVKPIGFIVVNATGEVSVLNIDQPGSTGDLGSSIQTIISKAPEIFGKIKSVFKKKDKTENEEAPDEEQSEEKKED